MPGSTEDIGQVESLIGVVTPEGTLDFSKRYPDKHLVIVSKKHMMRNGQTTQYDYFRGLGLVQLEQLPHPDKVLMGEPMDQYKRRKQVALDRDKVNRNLYKKDGVQSIASEQKTTVTTTYEHREE